ISKTPRGDHAGGLIEAAGLKGWRVGGARFSERHANFIVNDGRARAADVQALMAIAQRAVWERRGAWLGPAGWVPGGALWVALASAAPAAAARQVWETVRTHPYFAVRDVVIHHRGRLPAADLRTALGISVGESIWDIDAQAAEARLRARPWVRSASVRRELPDRVVVRVREYRPTAILVVGDAQPALYYVASNGRIFASVGDTDGRRCA